MLDGVWRSVCPAIHFTEGGAEARVWDGYESEVGQEVDGRARPECRFQHAQGQAFPWCP